MRQKKIKRDPLYSEQQRKAFKATRRHHRTEAAEDYCELISDILESHAEARTCHIAERLGISHVTAIRTLQRLQDEGYVTTEPRKPVALTTKGKRTAELAKKRHTLLVNFLVRIGVPREQAEIDIEGAEHHFSEATQRVIEKFLENG